MGDQGTENRERKGCHLGTVLLNYGMIKLVG